MSRCILTSRLQDAFSSIHKARKKLRRRSSLIFSCEYENEHFHRIDILGLFHRFKLRLFICTYISYLNIFFLECLSSSVHLGALIRRRGASTATHFIFYTRSHWLIFCSFDVEISQLSGQTAECAVVILVPWLSPACKQRIKVQKSVLSFKKGRLETFKWFKV